MDTQKTLAYENVDKILMIMHAAIKTLYGYVSGVKEGIKNGQVAMDGELREKITTVRKAGEIGLACAENFFERFGVTPPLKDPNLDMQCLVLMCGIMATADKTCLNDQAKETK